MHLKMEGTFCRRTPEQRHEAAPGRPLGGALSEAEKVSREGGDIIVAQIKGQDNTQLTSKRAFIMKEVKPWGACASRSGARIGREGRGPGLLSPRRTVFKCVHSSSPPPEGSRDASGAPGDPKCSFDVSLGDGEPGAGEPCRLQNPTFFTPGHTHALPGKF